jgi:hypothetical protein
MHMHEEIDGFRVVVLSPVGCAPPVGTGLIGGVKMKEERTEMKEERRGR